MATKTKASSRGTKTATKKKGLLSRINFRSRKTQFVATIALIAVAGAGYFTYSSFAATAAATWQAESGGVWIQQGGASCAVNTVNEAAKNNKKVWNVACPANGLVVINGNQGRALKLQGFYQVCALVKGGGRVTLIIDGTAGIKQTPVNVVNDGQYHEYCSQVSGSNSTTNDHISSIRVESGSWVSISYLQLQKVGTTSGTTPTPAPAK